MIETCSAIGRMQFRLAATKLEPNILTPRKGDQTMLLQTNSIERAHHFHFLIHNPLGLSSYQGHDFDRLERIQAELLGSTHPQMDSGDLRTQLRHCFLPFPDG